MRTKDRPRVPARARQVHGGLQASSTIGRPTVLEHGRARCLCGPGSSADVGLGPRPAAPAGATLGPSYLPGRAACWQTLALGDERGRRRHRSSVLHPGRRQARLKLGGPRSTAHVQAASSCGRSSRTPHAQASWPLSDLGEHASSSPRTGHLRHVTRLRRPGAGQRHPASLCRLRELRGRRAARTAPGCSAYSSESTSACHDTAIRGTFLGDADRPHVPACSEGTARRRLRVPVRLVEDPEP